VDYLALAQGIKDCGTKWITALNTAGVDSVHVDDNAPDTNLLLPQLELLRVLLDLVTSNTTTSVGCSTFGLLLDEQHRSVIKKCVTS